MNKLKLAALSAALIMSAGAQAVSVTTTYINNSATELRNSPLGRYASPTVYINRYACGEPQLSAFACGPSVISVGSSFLQGQENGYGNYVAKFIIGHEWGHSTQFRNGINKRAPYQELQADCLGGTHIKYLGSIGYPNFLNSAANSARAAADYSTHGTPQQRDYYTRAGYNNGLNWCYSSI